MMKESSSKDLTPTTIDQTPMKYSGIKAKSPSLMPRNTQPKNLNSKNIYQRSKEALLKQ